jgi:hypothetical protein
MNRYIRQTLLIALLLTGCVAVGNWLANPYLMFSAPIIKGINEWITENYYKQLQFKPYQLHQIKPRSIVIGASQAGVAFNPDLLPQPAYNLAVGGSTSYMHWRLLQETIASNPSLDTVILETPFFAFNSSDPANQPEQDKALENRLAIDKSGNNNPLQLAYAAQEILSSLISWDVTRASLRMIGKQRDVADKKRGSFIQLRNGQWIQQPPPDTSTARIIENSWKKSIYNDWLPAPKHIYTLPDNNSNALAYYRQGLQLLYSRHINTSIVIAPLHASLLIALRETNLWPTFQQWKKALVTINEEEAHKAGKPAFPVLDYAVINEYTSENLPLDKSTARLAWFNDSMHPSPAFGDLMLQEILGGALVYGRAMNSATIDAMLASDDSQLARYTALHPQQQIAIRTLLMNDPATNPLLSK